VAVAVALGLGALHALAPGHGKIMMAAYLVSREGSARQAVALALTVAATHTAGVLLLGAVLTITEVPSSTKQLWVARLPETKAGSAGGFSSGRRSLPARPNPTESS
jgi:ABC-type nickel/cobalt efflux system permease component RcnA